MITIVYWLYEDVRARARDRRVYTAEQVNAQLPMLDRHMPGPFQVVCITDDPTHLNLRIEALEMPCDDGPVEPDDDRFPPCFRKLWNFSKDAKRLIGGRILSLDIDSLITRRTSPIIERAEDLVVWRNRYGRILGGCYLLESGTHTEVWDDFDFTKSPDVLKYHSLEMSDQGWLNWKLPRCIPTFGPEVWLPSLGGPRDLPESAAIVSFGQPEKPWMPAAQQRWPWIKQHYEVANA